MRSNLQTRIITAGLLGGVLVSVLLLLPPAATIVVLTALVLVGAWEWSALLRVSNIYGRALYVMLIGALMYFAWRFTAAP